MQHQVKLRNITAMSCINLCASFELSYNKIKDYEDNKIPPDDFLRSHDLGSIRLRKNRTS